MNRGLRFKFNRQRFIALMFIILFSIVTVLSFFVVKSLFGATMTGTTQEGVINASTGVKKKWRTAATYNAATSTATAYTAKGTKIEWEMRSSGTKWYPSAHCKWRSNGSPTSSTTVDKSVGTEGSYSTGQKYAMDTATRTFTYARKCSAYTGHLYADTWWTDKKGTKRTSTADYSFTVAALAKYTITYSANTGTLASGTVSKCTGCSANHKAHGLTATLATAKPTKTGYTFGGWNTNSAGTGTNYAAGANYTGNANVTLYAKWTANTYSVQFNKNDDSATGTMSNESFTYDSAKALTENAFRLSGKSFVGWNTRADGTGTTYLDKQSVKNLTSTANGTVVLYAQWSDAVDNVMHWEGYSEFKAGQPTGYSDGMFYIHAAKDGELYDSAKISLTVPVSATAPTAMRDEILNNSKSLTLSSDNTSFVRIDSPFSTSKRDMGTTNSAYYYFYQPTGSIAVPAGYKYDSIKFVTSPTVSNHVIKMYTSDSVAGSGIALFSANPGPYAEDTVLNFKIGAGIIPSGLTTMPYEDENYRAYASLNINFVPNETVVTYDANGGTGSMDTLTVVYDTATSLDENTFINGKRKFVGWNTKADGTGISFEDCADVTTAFPTDSTVTLYAQWKNNGVFSLNDDVSISDVDLEKFTVSEGDTYEYEKSLRSGEQFLIAGLDLGTQYSITEEGNDEYLPSVEAQENKENVGTPSLDGEQGEDLVVDNEILEGNTGFKFHNEFRELEGGFYLTKVLSGDNITADDYNSTYSFGFELSNLKPNGEYKIMVEGDNGDDELFMTLTADANGYINQVVELNVGKAYHLVGLKRGNKYRIYELARTSGTPRFDLHLHGSANGEEYDKWGEEDVPGGYGIGTDEVEVERNAQVDSYEFTNADSNSHDLVLTKKARVDGNEVVREDEFTFVLYLSGLKPGVPYAVSDGGEPILDSDNDGEEMRVVRIKGGESVTISNLPGTALVRFEESTSLYDISYSLRNVDTGEYLVEKTKSDNGVFDLAEVNNENTVSGKFVLDSTYEVIASNETTTNKSLMIKKTFSGILANEDSTADFQIDFEKLGADMTYVGEKSDGSEISFTSNENGVGSVEFTLKNDEYVNFKSLPNTTLYDITEKASEATPAFFSTGRTDGLKTTALEGRANQDLETGKESLIVNRVYEFTNDMDTEPYKKVSDSDNVSIDGNNSEVEVEHNQVENISSSWTYTIRHDNIPANQESFRFHDELPKYLITDMILPTDTDDSVTDELGFEPPVTVYWTDSNGTRHGGEVVRERDEDGIMTYFVKEGSNVIFELEYDDGNDNAVITAELVDQSLLASGGDFEINITVRIRDDITVNDIKAAGLVAEDGFTLKWENTADTTVGTHYCETNPVDTIIELSDGLSVKKNVVDSLNNYDGSFSFLAEFSGLEPNKEYRYELTNKVRVVFGIEGTDLHIVATDAEGGSAQNVRVSIVDTVNDRVIKNVKTDGNGEAYVTLSEGEYSALVGYSGSVETTVPFSIEYDGTVTMSDEDEDTGAITYYEEDVYRYDGATPVDIVAQNTYGMFRANNEGSQSVPFTLISGQSINFLDLEDGCVYNVTENESPLEASYSVKQGRDTVEVPEKSNDGINEKLSVGENVFNNTSPVSIVYNNKPLTKPIRLKKVDANTGELLDNAYLRLLKGECHPTDDADRWSYWSTDENTIVAWDTKDINPYEIELPYGEVYTMIESTAPAKYEEANEIVFRITDEGDLQIKSGDSWNNSDGVEIVMEDVSKSNEIHVQKLEYYSETPIAGSHLVILDNNRNVIIPEFVSTIEPTIVELDAGDYILQEVGLDFDILDKYTIEPEEPFTVTEDGFIEAENGRMAAGVSVRFFDRAIITHNLEIEKNVTGDLGNLDKEFSFIVDFTDLNYDSEYHYTVNGTPKTFTSTSTGTAHVAFSLKDNQKAVFTDLQNGCFYQVMEERNDHKASYEMTAEGYYVETEDTEIDDSKVYYTRSGENPYYEYTKVDNPVIADISNYYEHHEAVLAKDCDANDNNNTDLMTESQVLNENTGDTQVVFTNNRISVNVTGVESVNGSIFKYLILGGFVLILSGLFTTVLLRKRNSGRIDV